MSNDPKPSTLPPALRLPVGQPPVNVVVVSPALKREMIAMSKTGGALHDR